MGLFRVDAVNREGGVGWMKIEPVVVDGRSNMKDYLQGTPRRMDEERIIAISGPYTTASRRTIIPKTPLGNHLSYYPTRWKGSECRQNLIWTAPLANQHLPINTHSISCRT